MMFFSSRHETILQVRLVRQVRPYLKKLDFMRVLGSNLRANLSNLLLNFSLLKR